MSREVALARGGVGSIGRADDKHVTVDVSAPSPPGSTLELLVANAPLGVKVRSCRRLSHEEPPRYRVEGRWVSLSRVQREALGIEL
jgi:hypothetical protein